jgi:hypothetical protein
MQVFRRNVPRSTEILQNQALKTCESGYLHLEATGARTAYSKICFSYVNNKARLFIALARAMSRCLLGARQNLCQLPPTRIDTGPSLCFFPLIQEQSIPLLATHTPFTTVQRITDRSKRHFYFFQVYILYFSNFPSRTNNLRRLPHDYANWRVFT